jgi:hypothetical protein
LARGAELNVVGEKLVVREVRALLDNDVIRLQHEPLGDCIVISGSEEQGDDRSKDDAKDNEDGDNDTLGDLETVIASH